MKVKDRMSTNLVTISPDASAIEAWETLQSKNLNRMPIVDRGRLLGMLTRTDFGSRRDLNLRSESATSEERRMAQKVKVRDLIPENQDLITVEQDAYIEQAAKILRDAKIGGMPVVDNDFRPVGIITQTDVFDAFLDMLAINKKGTRVTMHTTHDADNIVKVGEIVKKAGIRIENIVSTDNKDGSNDLIVRIAAVESREFVNDLKAAGFAVESVIIKN
ncbi:MAG: CBS domain-containing protein [Solirubrobacterales bacterium]